MRIAFVADFHGNRPATLALEADLKHQQVDQIYCLGDLVGKGPSSDFTFQWVMDHCDVVIGGNWDFGIGGKLYPNDEGYYRQLGEENLSILKNLPLEASICLSGRKIRLFHGRPIMKDLVMVQDDREAIMPLFQNEQGENFDVVLCADCHRQSMRTMNGGVFANCGSVGNGLGVPKVCYAIVEGDEEDENAPFEIRFRQVDYDVDQAVLDAENMKAQIPNMDIFISEIKTGVYMRRILPT